MISIIIPAKADVIFWKVLTLSPRLRFAFIAFTHYLRKVRRLILIFLNCLYECLYCNFMKMFYNLRDLRIKPARPIGKSIPRVLADTVVNSRRVVITVIILNSFYRYWRNVICVVVQVLYFRFLCSLLAR